MRFVFDEKARACANVQETESFVGGGWLCIGWRTGTIFTDTKNNVRDSNVPAAGLQ